MRRTTGGRLVLASAWGFGEAAGLLVSVSLFSARLGQSTAGSAGFFADGMLTTSGDTDPVPAGIAAVRRPMMMPMTTQLIARITALIVRVRTGVARGLVRYPLKFTVWWHRAHNFVPA